MAITTRYFGDSHYPDLNQLMFNSYEHWVLNVSGKEDLSCGDLGWRDWCQVAYNINIEDDGIKFSVTASDEDWMRFYLEWV